MTAHDTALSLDAERRGARYEDDEFTDIDVARMIDDDHARNGLECACENQPDGGTWTVDQPTYGAHIAAELRKAGLLK